MLFKKSEHHIWTVLQIKIKTTEGSNEIEIHREAEDRNAFTSE